MKQDATNIKHKYVRSPTRPKSNMSREFITNDCPVSKPIRCGLCNLLYADINSYNDHIIECVKEHPEVNGYTLKKEI